MVTKPRKAKIDVIAAGTRYCGDPGRVKRLWCAVTSTSLSTLSFRAMSDVEVFTTLRHVAEHVRLNLMQP